MTQERWHQIEQLYHAALEKNESERVAYLRTACAGDAELHREVESLLGQDGGADGFLDSPAIKVAAMARSDSPTSSLIGRQLGSYHLLAQIGTGGMGEVYRAKDSKLGRDVAIKVLPPAFAGDPERLARFRREAKLLASLNHPNIATIHGLEESAGVNFLVMELVEGETLAERVAAGPLPVRDALVISQQVAEGLEAAHKKNLTHRDIKPANIKLTPEGVVKVLDFGLAKVFADESAGPSDAPTLSQRPSAMPTEAGRILGTPAYMSPEQAQGKPVDKQTDIWAFGCVLYELLTGEQAFSGENVSQTIVAVLRSEPDWKNLPQDTPPTIRTLLRRCLQKDPSRRFHSAADLSIEIEEALAEPASAPATTPHPAWRRTLPVVLAAVVVAVIAGIAVWRFRPATGAAPRPVERLTIGLGPDFVLATSAWETVALSPDGSHLVVVASRSGGYQQLYLRPMDALEARPLSGTGGATSPFFSPDGQWIGFFADGSLKKVSITGGAVLTLARIGDENAGGGTWGLDHTIVFAPGTNDPLLQVSAAGGEPQRFTTLQQGESDHWWPQFLPDGKTVLFTVGATTNPDDSQIAVQPPGATEHKILIRGGTYGRYVPTGHLVYYRAGTIMAVPFDPDRLELRGAPAPVQEGVMSSIAGAGAAQFSFSERGTLVYVPGGPQRGEFEIVWVDRNGTEQSLPVDTRADNSVRLSPDGQRAALILENDVWIYDLSRGTLTRLTFEGTNSGPNWTPDSKRIAFRSTREGESEQMYWKLADGTGPEERLTTSKNIQRPGSFTPDGKTLMYTEIDPKTGIDLWVLPLDGERQPHPYLQTPFNEETGRISPDGSWVAYLSDESGRYEIYVRPFPDASGGKWQISNDGGQEIAWAPSGKELFYRTGAARERMMVVDIQTQPSFVPGRPRLLFEAPYYSRGVTGSDYGVSPDGQRFLMIKAPTQGATSPQINVVLNWFEELKQKVPPN